LESKFTVSPGENPGEPLGRRERKKLETRRRIFRSAFQLFSTKGFEDTTVEEIAELADVAKGTVFNYFPHKRALLLAAHSGWMSRLEEDLGLPESWDGTVRDHLLKILAFLADLSIQHREVSRLVIFESMREAHLRLDAGDEIESQESLQLLEGLLKRVVRQGQARGELRPNFNSDQAASVLAATAFSTLVRWLVKGGSAEEMKSALEAKVDLIFEGLIP